MKKMMILCFSIILIFTGGCSMNDSQNGKNGNQEEAVKPKDMDPKDLPRVPAFQDEKTREYMASTKEVEPGYYLLESKLKGFTMLFPEDGEYEAELSSNNEKNIESLAFNSYDKKTNIVLNAQVKYYSQQSYVNKPKTMLEIISGQNGYKGKYQKIDQSGKDIYFAHMKEVFDDIDRKYNFSYSYFGYVKSTEEDYLGVEYNFTFACHKEDQPCSLSEEKARKTAKKLVNSITFSTEGEEK
ncbi:lipoprotein YvcA [Bacillus paralicheniformis]|uniref:lipoprotein YvcA n=1 Tax=Bacillus paralicheniformis TaxID=1648923 RepID=UPI00228190ED|nr:lipoprotein YvcA [Bacillus paralicheniformis]MCY8149871.1 lipoprotein YvcA [Bacillus paralicheniformis]MCY9419499.1 lipoprotein YvcA [Bacillus paralicheniformis]MEC0577919.1 lipoprotein YvcA [Bacillus paralicheniformis]